MALKVTLLDELGEPFVAGMGVDLLRGEHVAASAQTDGNGSATFDLDPAAGPYLVRMQVSDELATPSSARKSAAS